MRKARKISNILKGQRPHKKRKASKKILLSTLLLLTFMALVTSITWFIKKSGWHIRMPVISSPAMVTYDVFFTPISDKRLNSGDLNNITQTINSNLNLSPHKDLALLAKKIQNQYAAQQVNINQTDASKIGVTIALRDPVLLVKADKTRFVDNECSIYGELHPGDSGSDLPVLFDIFADQENKLKLTDTGTYFVSVEQQKLICDAIGLLTISREKGLDFGEIHFLKYRGFSARTKLDGVEILLGYAPFNKRIDRLTEILLNLKKEGVSATRIELDYDNKAFVKEKSSETQRSL